MADLCTVRILGLDFQNYSRENSVKFKTQIYSSTHTNLVASEDIYEYIGVNILVPVSLHCTALSRWDILAQLKKGSVLKVTLKKLGRPMLKNGMIVNH